MRNGKCTREFALVPSYTVTIDFHPESCWKTEYGKCTHSPRWVHNKTIAQAFVLTLGLSFCRIALSFCFWVQMYFGVAASILWVFKEQWYLFSYHCSLCSFLFVYEFHNVRDITVKGFTDFYQYAMQNAVRRAAVSWSAADVRRYLSKSEL